MHRHKAVAQIFLFLSIVNFTFAGVAQTSTTHEMRVDLVTGAEDTKGHTQSELPEWLGTLTTRHLHSRLDPEPEDPETKKFFNKVLIRKLKEYLILGTIAGAFIGVANGIQKQIAGTVSPDAYVFLYLSSCQHLCGVGRKPILTGKYFSQTIGRSVEPLDELPQDQEHLVSRSLSNMGDEELKMLSVISRRMLSSLDQGAAPKRDGVYR